MKRILFSLLLLAGCATGSHVITGNVRRATVPDAVKIYVTMPEKAEVIGLVNSANIWLTKQPGMNSSIQKLKVEAARLGANGVVINNQKNDGWTGAAMQGTAIYVP